MDQWWAGDVNWFRLGIGWLLLSGRDQVPFKNNVYRIRSLENMYVCVYVCMCVCR